MIAKGYLSGVACALLMVVSQTWANTAAIDIESNPEAGVVNPVSVQALTGEDEGNKFLSFTADIMETVEDQIDGTITDVTAPFEEWSYSRGIGTIPNSCPAGYSESAGMCAQNCPQGFNAVAGVCWQQCPPGFSDTGAFCTKWKWWPKTITKKSWVQPRSLMNCQAGMNKEAGLCYEPCADTFTGVGPLCFGQFGGLVDQQRILDQSGAQQAAALASGGQGGIVLGNGQTPKLKTDMSFTPIVCGLEAIEGAFGLPIPDPVNIGGSIVNASGDAIVNAISNSVSSDSAAWFVPSLADTVLFDFSAQASCVTEGSVTTAGLNFHPSITVKASTKMFDTALHSATGVDLGIMQISLYELIPFRVYGTVGTTLGADTTISSTIDRAQPPVIIDGRQHANVTSLSVVPEMDLWISAEAYLRITSFLSFIPDLLQLGAEFKLWVMELTMPYYLEEGVRPISTDNLAEGYEVYKVESLATNIAAGNGYINTFLRVLGFDINAFGDNADVHWQGTSYSEVVFATEEADAVQL